jgi:hypothetical protein
MKKIINLFLLLSLSFNCLSQDTFLQGLSEKIIKEVKDKMKSAAPNTLQADNRGFTNALP